MWQKKAQRIVATANNFNVLVLFSLLPLILYSGKDEVIFVIGEAVRYRAIIKCLV